MRLTKYGLIIIRICFPVLLLSLTGWPVALYAGTFAKVNEVAPLHLGESIFVDTCNPSDMTRDRDNDMLKDDLEGYVADYFRPYFRFDAQEEVRQDPVYGDAIREPVTLFQIRPAGCINCPDNAMIKIRFVFVYNWDGGYQGDCSGWWCLGDSHPGDHDNAEYDISVTDNGKTFNIATIGVGVWKEPNIRWPDNVAQLEVYYEDPAQMHPVLYISGTKHHMYLDDSYDCRDSHYTEHGCNDSVDGLSELNFLSDLKSIFDDGRYNNVGEPEPGSHPDTYFVDDLSNEFPEYVYLCKDTYGNDYPCDPPEPVSNAVWSSDMKFRCNLNGPPPLKDVWIEDDFYTDMYGGRYSGVTMPGDHSYVLLEDLTIVGGYIHIDPNVRIIFPAGAAAYGTGTKITAEGVFEAPSPGSSADSVIYFTSMSQCPVPKVLIRPGGRMRMSNGGAMKFR